MNYKKTATRLRGGDFEYRGYRITRMPANEWLILSNPELPKLAYPVEDGIEVCPRLLSEAKRIIDITLAA